MGWYAKHSRAAVPEFEVESAGGIPYDGGHGADNEGGSGRGNGVNEAATEYNRAPSPSVQRAQPR